MTTGTVDEGHYRLAPTKYDGSPSSIDRSVGYDLVGVSHLRSILKLAFVGDVDALTEFKVSPDRTAMGSAEPI